MALVTREAAEQAAAAPPRRHAAILVFEGVQIIDFTGPYEVLGQAGFQVHTVARTTEPLVTAMGLQVTPSDDFATVTSADVLVIPGGDVHGAVEDSVTIAWVNAVSERAEYTMSVCNGAFILAAAGLLDGKSATTFYGLIDELREVAPDTEVVRDRRYVDNGRILTTAGLSSGIDGTLALIGKMYGHGRAQEVALHIEYDWRPDSGFARAALADRRMPRLRLEGLTDLRTLSTAGTRDRWERRVAFSSERPIAEITAEVETRLAESGWSPVKGGGAEAAPGAPAAQTAWRFTDEAGDSWEGSVAISPDPGEEASFRLTISLARKG
jgi:putative intracellular protease/amidase